MARSSEKTPPDNTDTQLLPVGNKIPLLTSFKNVDYADQNPTSALPLTDAAIAAGYKYDGNTSGEDYPEDEEQYYPYDDAKDVHASAVAEVSSSKFWNNKTFTTVIVASTQERQQIPFIYLLGSTLHPLHDYHKRKSLEKSLFWFTYRYDFSEIKPYQITTDAGWGCMLRSAQMLLAHAFRVHFSQSRQQWHTDSSNKVSSPSSSDRSSDSSSKQLLTWFVDIPSTNACFYSLHNMCAAGLAKHQVLPGEWYGPGTACYVLRDLVAMHKEQQPSIPLFRVHVATEGTVYRQVIEELMTQDGRARQEEKKRQQQQSNASTNDNGTSTHPLDPLSAAVAETDSGSRTSKPPTTSISLEWDTSLLLMIPLRLGLNKFQPDYAQSLARTFALPQSVGILGGRPRGARWFFGSYADGSKILGLDPHTVQPAISTPLTEIVQGRLPAAYLRSLHTEYPETIDLLRMDPSIALGFFCRNRKDLQDLEAALHSISVSDDSTTMSTATLVTFMEKAPNYEDTADSTALLMNGMLLDDDDALIPSSSSTQPKSTSLLDDDDDNEDYVLL